MTAPDDASALAFREGDEPFATEPDRSFTIPARWYFDPEIYEREKAAIFERNWWLAGHVSRLREPGDYLMTRVFEQEVMIVRGRDGEIRAFYNVCQHRGHELVKDSAGRIKNLMVCPYHAWAYDLDGSLVRARNTEDLPGFDKCNFALAPVRVETFMGFVFVNLDPDAAPLGPQTEGLEDEVRSYMPRLDKLTYACRYEYRIKANWKVVLDNFLECYHCHPAHPALVDLMDMDTYKTRTHRIYSSHVAGAPRSNKTAAYDFEPGDVDFGYAAWLLWPNTTIWAYPGEPNILSLQIIPDGPEHTIEYMDCYLLDETPSKQMQDALTYMDEVLQPEDIGLCESVQRGLRSKGYNQGRFVVDRGLSELSEHGVHHFQKLVVDALGGV